MDSVDTLRPISSESINDVKRRLQTVLTAIDATLAGNKMDAPASILDAAPQAKSTEGEEGLQRILAGMGTPEIVSTKNFSWPSSPPQSCYAASLGHITRIAGNYAAPLTGVDAAGASLPLTSCSPSDAKAHTGTSAYFFSDSGTRSSDGILELQTHGERDGLESKNVQYRTTESLWMCRPLAETHDYPQRQRTNRSVTSSERTLSFLQRQASTRDTSGITADSVLHTNALEMNGDMAQCLPRVDGWSESHQRASSPPLHRGVMSLTTVPRMKEIALHGGTDSGLISSDGGHQRNGIVRSPSRDTEHHQRQCRLQKEREETTLLLERLRQARTGEDKIVPEADRGGGGRSIERRLSPSTACSLPLRQIHSELPFQRLHCDTATLQAGRPNSVHQSVNRYADALHRSHDRDVFSLHPTVTSSSLDDRATNLEHTRQPFAHGWGCHGATPVSTTSAALVHGVSTAGEGYLTRFQGPGDVPYENQLRRHVALRRTELEMQHRMWAQQREEAERIMRQRYSERQKQYQQAESLHTAQLLEEQTHVQQECMKYVARAGALASTADVSAIHAHAQLLQRLRMVSERLSSTSGASLSTSVGRKKGDIDVGRNGESAASRSPPRQKRLTVSYHDGMSLQETKASLRPVPAPIAPSFPTEQHTLTSYGCGTPAVVGAENSSEEACRRAYTPEQVHPEASPERCMPDGVRGSRQVTPDGIQSVSPPTDTYTRHPITPTPAVVPGSSSPPTMAPLAGKSGRLDTFYHAPSCDHRHESLPFADPEHDMLSSSGEESSRSAVDHRRAASVRSQRLHLSPSRRLMEGVCPGLESPSDTGSQASDSGSLQNVFKSVVERDMRRQRLSCSRPRADAKQPSRQLETLKKVPSPKVTSAEPLRGVSGSGTVKATHSAARAAAAHTTVLLAVSSLKDKGMTVFARIGDDQQLIPAHARLSKDGNELTLDVERIVRDSVARSVTPMTRVRPSTKASPTSSVLQYVGLAANTTSSVPQSPVVSPARALPPVQMLDSMSFRNDNVVGTRPRTVSPHHVFSVVDESRVPSVRSASVLHPSRSRRVREQHHFPLFKTQVLLPNAVLGYTTGLGSGGRGSWEDVCGALCGPLAYTELRRHRCLVFADGRRTHAYRVYLHVKQDGSERKVERAVLLALEFSTRANWVSFLSAILATIHTAKAGCSGRTPTALSYGRALWLLAVQRLRLARAGGTSHPHVVTVPRSSEPSTLSNGILLPPRQFLTGIARPPQDARYTGVTRGRGQPALSDRFALPGNVDTGRAFSWLRASKPMTVTNPTMARRYRSATRAPADQRIVYQHTAMR